MSNFKIPLKSFCSIRHAKKSDIAWMVDLSHAKRENYQKVQKQFWKMAKNSDQIQSQFFAEEIDKPNVLALCDHKKRGFVIGKIISPPQVYDAGLTLMIDDFCVETPELWNSVGVELFSEICALAKLKNAKQILAVCGDHDLEKSAFLKKLNLSVVSNWLAASLT
jgi:hypothetical protein